jgi:hypothetical protein
MEQIPARTGAELVSVSTANGVHCLYLGQVRI